jgi:hypothetical protein
MNISKPNDIMVALVNNPTATTYDLKTLNINPDNTSLFSKDEYKNSEYIKKIFTENNKFNEVAFNNFYERAAKQYMELSDEAYLKELEKVEFSPFDETRPIDSNVYNINLEYSKEKNPFQQVYGRRSLDSVEDSPLSLREIAQQGKIYDTKNNK